MKDLFTFFTEALERRGGDWRRWLYESSADDVYVDPSDWKLQMPAARCRECHRVTWQCSLARGHAWYLGDKAHAKDCTMPPSALEEQACANPDG